MSGAIYPHFKGGLTQLDSLRTLAGTGKPYILTTGYGQVLAPGASVRSANSNPRCCMVTSPASWASPWSLIAMATTYRTCDGDLLDTLCNQHYASLDGTVEAVLSANPGLASQAQPYAAGIQITMPDIATPVETEVQLWD